MFGNKISLLNFLKLSKNKVRRKATAPLSFCSSKSTEIRQQKLSDCAFINVNGSASSVVLSRNPVEIRKVQNLSSVSRDVCWKCQKDLEIKQFRCASCGALQYPKENINFFELLSVSQMYDIDVEDLSKKFKNMQMMFHPDKFANKSKNEIEISEAYSSLLNKAYSTLKDPLARGLYILELQNITTEGDFDMEPDFLMLIMEKNEQLECLSCLKSLTSFMERNNESIDEQIKLISKAFKVSNLDDAKFNLLKLNYFINLDKKIKEKQTKIITTLTSE